MMITIVLISFYSGTRQRGNFVCNSLFFVNFCVNKLNLIVGSFYQIFIDDAQYAEKHTMVVVLTDWGQLDSISSSFCNWQQKHHCRADIGAIPSVKDMIIWRRMLECKIVYSKKELDVWWKLNNR